MFNSSKPNMPLFSLPLWVVLAVLGGQNFFGPFAKARIDVPDLEVGPRFQDDQFWGLKLDRENLSYSKGSQTYLVSYYEIIPPGRIRQAQFKPYIGILRQGYAYSEVYLRRVSGFGLFGQASISKEASLYEVLFEGAKQVHSLGMIEATPQQLKKASVRSIQNYGGVDLYLIQVGENLYSFHPDELGLNFNGKVLSVLENIKKVSTASYTFEENGKEKDFFIGLSSNGNLLKISTDLSEVTPFGKEKYKDFVELGGRFCLQLDTEIQCHSMKSLRFKLSLNPKRYLVSSRFHSLQIAKGVLCGLDEGRLVCPVIYDKLRRELEKIKRVDEVAMLQDYTCIIADERKSLTCWQTVFQEDYKVRRTF